MRFRFGQGSFPIRRHPGNVLAHVCYLNKEGIQPGSFCGPAKGLFVQQWTAGRYDNAVQLMLGDVALDQRMSWVRTHVFVRLRHRDIGQLLSEFAEFLHVDRGRDIGPAVADINPGPGLIIGCNHGSLSAGTMPPMARTTSSPISTT